MKKRRSSSSFYYIHVSVSPFYSFVYFFLSSQDDLEPGKKYVWSEEGCQIKLSGCTFWWSPIAHSPVSQRQQPLPPNSNFILSAEENISALIEKWPCLVCNKEYQQTIIWQTAHLSQASLDNSVIPIVSHIALAEQEIPWPRECVWIIMAFTHMRILPQGECCTSTAWTECPNTPFPAGRSLLRYSSRQTLGGEESMGGFKRKKKKAELKKRVSLKSFYRKWSCLNYMW